MSCHRAANAITTESIWGRTCEVITLKSGDQRRRKELADRAKRLRVLRKYNLAPANDGKTGGCGGGDGEETRGDYDDDGFEGEVCF